jgi:hypothetical protein
MKDKVYVALIDPQDTYPLVFKRTRKARLSFEKAWDKAHGLAKAKFPREWQYDDIEKIMVQLGYAPLPSEFLWGE